MKYFAFNGPSPHCSIWKDCGGNLKNPRRICATELEGIPIEKSAIEDIARGKILEKFPYLVIPLLEYIVDEHGNKKPAPIKGAEVGDHIICFSTINEKYISANLEEDVPIILDDFEIIAPNK